MYSLGIDIGYSSIKLVILQENETIIYRSYILHKGNVKECLFSEFKKLKNNVNVHKIKSGAITGSNSSFLTNNDPNLFVNEVTANIEGAKKINANVRSIIEIGGQSSKFITGFHTKDNSAIKISMNSNCSAGTGSFLEELVSRLNLKIENYSEYVKNATEIPRIAGRCSVFAKTDITHHQQEGVTVENILLGLSYAVVKNFKGTIIHKIPIKKPIYLSGGISYNKGIIIALKDVLHLQDNELITEEESPYTTAIGLAVISKRQSKLIAFEELENRLKEFNGCIEENDFHYESLNQYKKNDSYGKHDIKVNKINQEINGYLGIDVGSTSTNIVLIDETNEVIDFQYIKTYGKPVETVFDGFKKLHTKFPTLKILGVGVTGSGRYMIGNMVGADIIKDEITAQAKAAAMIVSDADTIFEIGGQDSKYISLKDGKVHDFQMNKICAAGTGSFIEEQAKKLNIPLYKFGDLALKSTTPSNLGDRCTVFIETSVSACIAKGNSIEDIAAGLCYSIVNNYLNKVVGQKKIGDKILLQGGIAYNQGVVNAFRSILHKDITVTPYFSVTGAYGVAMLAHEDMIGKKTTFLGFTRRKKEQSNEKLIEKENTFNQKMKTAFLHNYDGNVDSSKKTVGIPQVLFIQRMFPMLHVFFKKLGFNVLLSSETNEDTIRKSQEYATDETCYPVKLVNGHIAELFKKKVDYICLPDFFTADHPDSISKHNYGCVYMQSVSKMVATNFDFGENNPILFNPIISFESGMEFMKNQFINIGKVVGKNEDEIMNALQDAMQSMKEFDQRIASNSQKLLSEVKKDEKVFVIVSKIYNVMDPVLNMKIPQKLINMGYKVLSFYDLPEMEDNGLGDYSNLFWPFSQHILTTAHTIKQYPNLYPILITNHGCGPDGIVLNYFKNKIGNKPYLNIEVDEHSSDVGVITRIEAFINGLNSDSTKDTLESEVSLSVKNEIYLENCKEKTICFPNIYPYSDILKVYLENDGYCVKILKETDDESIHIGKAHTISNEYFSLCALAGDFFKEQKKSTSDMLALLIPQSYGADTYGQYSRWMQTKLEENAYYSTCIYSPFLENILNSENCEQFFLHIIAGDIVKNAPEELQDKLLRNLLSQIKNKNLDEHFINLMADEIIKEQEYKSCKKSILAIGEPLIMYNDYLSNDIFKKIKNSGNSVLYAPFSETLWLFWKDYCDFNHLNQFNKLLKKLQKYMETIAKKEEHCIFSKNLKKMLESINQILPMYAGNFGRYRKAKMLDMEETIDGIVNVASMYENTHIALNMTKDFSKKPILHFTFDGIKNKNNDIKLESFLYYL